MHNATEYNGQGAAAAVATTRWLLNALNQTQPRPADLAGWADRLGSQLHSLLARLPAPRELVRMAGADLDQYVAIRPRLTPYAQDTERDPAYWVGVLAGWLRP